MTRDGRGRVLEAARQFLRYIATMKRLPGEYGSRRVDEMLELVNLTAEADRRLRGYSGGMNQRVGIAQALLNNTEWTSADALNRAFVELQNRWSASLAMSTDGSFPSRPRQFLNTKLIGARQF